MVAYLDSSVALRHILLGEEIIRHVLACERVISSELLEIECKRVFHRYRLNGELDDDGFVTALSRLKDVLGGVSLLALSDTVKRKAAGPFPVVVKTLDALHLASAQVFSERFPEEKVLIFSHDTGMNRCALALGLTAPLS
ncbi:MAG: hypothetical protein JW760_09635 [Spirochaetales bacterium]|nr:hypothetical protein [Spirochaetales bacterium]